MHFTIAAWMEFLTATGKINIKSFRYCSYASTTAINQLNVKCAEIQLIYPFYLQRQLNSKNIPESTDVIRY